MNFSEMEKIIENDKDGIEMIVIDYIIMLWLHEKGWLDENYNLTENAPLATAVNSTLSKIDLPQYQILLKLLGKRLKKTEDENKDLQLAVDLAIIEIEANLYLPRSSSPLCYAVFMAVLVKSVNRDTMSRLTV